MSRRVAGAGRPRRGASTHPRLSRVGTVASHAKDAPAAAAPVPERWWQAGAGSFSATPCSVDFRHFLEDPLDRRERARIRKERYILWWVLFAGFCAVLAMLIYDAGRRWSDVRAGKGLGDTVKGITPFHF